MFAEQGYERTSLRAIAALAGVDPALVTHYFGSKQRLFVSVVAPPVDPALVIAHVVEGDPAKAGERLARFVLSVLEDPAGRARLTGLVRAAASEPEAAALLRDRVTRDLYGPVTAALGDEDPELRANLVGSQVMGLVMGRYVVELEPLASASPDALVRAVGPVLQHYLTGPLS